MTMRLRENFTVRLKAEFEQRARKKSGGKSSPMILIAVLLCSLAGSLSSALAQAPPAQSAPPDSSTQTTPPATTPAPPAIPYQPKFAGDPARSESEANALAYMRVVLRAQRQFEKQYDHFATTLPELVHSGSFTKRLVNTNRGDYTANFQGKKDSFILTMTPRQLDAQHRSFYAEEDFKIHADETKAADGESPVVK
jgi:hypothetical protein